MNEPRYTCPLCKYSCNSHEAERNHLETKKHFVEFLKYYLWEHEDFLVGDKRKVKISCQEIVDCIPAIAFRLMPNQELKLTLLVSLAEDSPSRVFLQTCTFLHQTKVFVLEDEAGVCAGHAQVPIEAGTTYSIVLQCLAQQQGRVRIPLAFKFQEDNPNKRLFTIVRYIDATIWEDGGDNLEPVEPYTFVVPLPQLPDSDRIIPGKRPKSNNIQELERKKPLAQYILDEQLVEFQKHELQEWDGMDDDMLKLLIFIKKHLDDPISEDTYWGRFSTLLYLEEIQMQTDIRKYDMLGAQLNPCATQTDMYVLEVPGLVEGRPSVLKGDNIFVRISSEQCEPSSQVMEVLEYEGFVFESRKGSLLISFCERFERMYVRGMKFDVRFTYNRLPLRLMHRAIGMLEKVDLWSFVLPKCTFASQPSLKIGRLQLFNQKIASNPEQFTAVKNILLGLHRPYPYLLFGPPGTGKTVTLVEALKQVCTLIPSSHVLVVAPSNSACDVLAERLIDHMSSTEVFRMYSASVHPTNMSKKLVKVSNYNHAEKVFVYPCSEQLMRYKVIVATLACTGKLVTADFALNHFTHIFVDEAGQSLEPECLIPVVGLMSPWDPKKRGPGGHFILAGDPKQLGPVIRSRLAQHYNLDISLLERLMDCGPYQRMENGYYNPQMLTKLLKNFRSHEDIIEVPNKLFYENELQVYGDEVITHSMVNWEELPRKGCPLIFHSVLGRDLRESSCPSYFNPEEIKVVVNYVVSLLQGKSGLGVQIKGKDIGIVSPYRKQVLKIRSVLEKRGIDGVTVGSTEEFQGQERLVMIISTVRSDSNLLQNDFRHRLGFLKNRKRFNVAVTRAKALLIIVGNPYTLRSDRCWKRLIELCRKKGAMKGVEYNDGDEHICDLEDRFAKAGIGECLSPEDQLIFQGKIPITQKTLQEEPQWREEL
ncbi:putative helicase MOV-10 isoform X1 [Dermacentor variabilis]|uniref:putative helicase MOV-10 isoform X1 n=1 Tax=Dermacentor variabilis TaxID=34621 RepID=UPI003F5BE6E4